MESRNFDIRKTLIKFDDVMNDQRQVIFSQRLKILKENNINEILNDFFEILLLIVLLFYLFVEILFFRNSKNPDGFRLRFFAIIEGLFVFAVISIIFSSFLFISELDKNSFFQTWDFLIVIFSCFVYFYLFSVSMTGFILKTFYSAEWVVFIREDEEKRKGRS